MSRIFVVLMSVFFLFGCSSAQNVGNSIADKIARFSADSNIGKPYADIAAQRDWTLERNYVIGTPIGRETLGNGNRIFFHESRQVSPSRATVFDLVSVGDKHVRYDYYAYLVSPDGVILDYAHKRSNAKIPHFGYDTGIVAFEIEGDERTASNLEQIDEFVTSSGENLTSWQ